MCVLMTAVVHETGEVLASAHFCRGTAPVIHLKRCLVIITGMSTLSSKPSETELVFYLPLLYYLAKANCLRGTS